MFSISFYYVSAPSLAENALHAVVLHTSIKTLSCKLSHDRKLMIITHTHTSISSTHRLRPLVMKDSIPQGPKSGGVVYLVVSSCVWLSNEGHEFGVTKVTWIGLDITLHKVSEFPNEVKLKVEAIYRNYFIFTCSKMLQHRSGSSCLKVDTRCGSSCVSECYKYFPVSMNICCKIQANWFSQLVKLST